MPFFDDSGIRYEEHRGLLWNAVARFGDQIERMIALNIAWALQLLPAVLALSLPVLPLWVRVGLIAYTSVAIFPATGALYGMMRAVYGGEQLTVALAREMVTALALPSVRALLPLYTLAALLWSASTLAPLAVATLLRMAVLGLALLSNRWGPLLAANPTWSAPALLLESARMFWREPLRGLLLSGIVLLVAGVAAVSVGGLFLAAPVLIALVQTGQRERRR